MIGILVVVAIAVIGGSTGRTWTNAKDIGKVSERTATLEANMKHIDKKLETIAEDVKTLLDRKAK